MRLVLGTPRGERELAVDALAADVTLAEVLAAAGEDATVEVVAGEGTRQPTAPVARLEVVAGPGAGGAAPLDRPLVVGSAPTCDVVVPGRAVAPAHCRVTPVGPDAVTITLLPGAAAVRVDDLPCTTGVVTAPVGAVLRLGGAVLRAAPPARGELGHADRGAVGVDDRRLFHRPPREGPPPPPRPIPVPASPAPPVEPPSVSAVALLVPLALAGVLVLTLGSWRYAAFLLLGPVLLLTTTLTGRRRARRSARAAARAHAVAIEELVGAVAAAATAARREQWARSPSIATVVRRATSIRRWERRLDHHDALELVVGVGRIPWSPPLEEGQHQPDAAVVAALDPWTEVADTPVVVDLTQGAVIGIVGPRPHAVAVARSLLVQACVHHGPADVAVAILAEDQHVGDWTWASWLPHVEDGTGRRRLAVGTAAAEQLATAPPPTDGRVLLTVADDRDLLRGRRAALDQLLASAPGPTAGIVLADTAAVLPAGCAWVLEVDDDGRGRLVRPATRTAVAEVDLAGLPTTTCRAVARHLATIEDSELPDTAADLPVRVDLLDLLPHGTDVAAAWDRPAASGTLRVPVGLSPDGPLHLDLVADGPHALLAGTTGAGKSELLRSLVVGLAATHDPEHCTFVLVDYKGGAAFDACADLPHVVGVVTDLDDHLAARALRSLEAELAHRERRLRDAGVSDLAAWSRLPTASRGAPLPRLLVVVDEFATLRAELPTFVMALVGIAQRGRSLGVHLVLGTQRPAGAVDDDVRANVALRIALRTTDRSDSQDVVGVGDAADIPAALPGRGLVRVGPAAPVAVQAALVSGVRGEDRPRLRIGPVRFAPTDLLPQRPGATAGATDLERLVGACRAAWGDRPAPRRPWVPPLPAVLSSGALAAVAAEDEHTVPLGLLDDPDHQRQVAAGWDLRRGSLLVLGAVGSGTTTTLAAAVLAAARRSGPDGLHVHVLDLGHGGLLPLRGLPHCGAVVTAREPARRARLEAWWLAEAARRRTLGPEELAACPWHVLVVDGLTAWLDDLDQPDRLATLEAVQRLLAEAPALRMAVVASARRPGELRTSVLAAVEQRIVHRLADPADLAVLGLRPSTVPVLPPGRAVRPDGLVLQVVRPALEAEVGTVASAWPPATRAPAPLPTLPSVVAPATVDGAVQLHGPIWHVPVGLDALTLAPVGWHVHAGDHALVLGPALAERTDLLGGLARLAAPHVQVVAVSDRTDVWPAGVRLRPPAALASVLDEARHGDAPTFVLVDAAGALPDPGRALDRLHEAGARVHLVAAARPVDLQRDYGHWLRRVAASRTGVLLPTAADTSAAGDLLGVRLPRRSPVPATAARGWVVDAGAVTFGQVLGAPG